MKIRMLNRRTLVRLDENQSKDWKGFKVVSQGYRQDWDWEIGTVVESVEYDIRPGDRVLVRAPSGGVAGTDVARSFGERMVIVNYDEILAKVDAD
ncbi:MAG: hypothetical protein OXH01_07845 [Bacteroidetes bacterium]|nr:hypothetical protein [Bacteroidota bacterium]